MNEFEKTTEFVLNGREYRKVERFGVMGKPVKVFMHSHKGIHVLYFERRASYEDIEKTFKRILGEDF